MKEEQFDFGRLIQILIVIVVELSLLAYVVYLVYQGKIGFELIT